MGSFDAVSLGSAAPTRVAGRRAGRSLAARSGEPGRGIGSPLDAVGLFWPVRSRCAERERTGHAASRGLGTHLRR